MAAWTFTLKKVSWKLLLVLGRPGGFLRLLGNYPAGVPVSPGEFSWTKITADRTSIIPKTCHPVRISPNIMTPISAATMGSIVAVIDARLDSI